MAFPMTTWSRMSGGTLLRSSAAFAAIAPSSMAERSFKAPPGFPLPARPPTHSAIGVRAPFKMTTDSREVMFRPFLLGGVVVEAAARLPAEVAGKDHALQERRGREARLPELLAQDVRGGIGGIEADEVEEVERPERIAAGELHAVVDGLLRREPRLVDADGVEDVGDEEAVHDETGGVLRDDRRLPDRLDVPLGAFERGVVGRERADDLDQLHERHGVEEVEP